MTGGRAFIGIDWGTSNARFMLVDSSGHIIEQRRGPGIGQLAGCDQIEQACFDAIADWLNMSPGLPVIMAGMVGSNLGWHLVDYVGAPAAANDILAGVIHFEARGERFFIAPGLVTQRSDGLPDTMRGEEVQVLGAASGGDNLFCLPGTHSKWVNYAGGKITGFHTALTGELANLIGRHSILLSPRRAVEASPSDEFLEGVEVAQQSPMGLESLLFSVRGRQITGSLISANAQDYLAGLLIGCEIGSARELYGQQGAVALIGTPQLTALYATALSHLGIASRQINGDGASLRGLFRIYQSLDTDPS